MPRVSCILAMAGVAASAARAQSVVTWQRVELPGYAAYVSLDTVGVATRVPGGRNLAFARLREAYRALHVPTELDDSVGGMLGTLRVTRSLSFAGVSLSRSLECGEGPTGPLADNARVQFALVSFIEPAGADSTLLRTALVGSAMPMDGALSGPVRCTSTGYVEASLRRQLGGRTR
jgi:hypothetical protein